VASLTNAEGESLAVASFGPVSVLPAYTCLFHIPGWPLAPAAPPGWVPAGFGPVWLLVITYLATLAFSRFHRTPYDRLAGSK
jgi:hypothetical protein